MSTNMKFESGNDGKHVTLTAKFSEVEWYVFGWVICAYFSFCAGSLTYVIGRLAGEMSF